MPPDRASSRRKSWMPMVFGGLAAALAYSAQAQVEPDLSEMSLEELATVEVTSVSRRAESIGEAPASVYVISHEEIRRSGVLSLPEALRLAPNLDVARLDSLTYAISARGFNSFQSSNKLLVLIDGRSVYTPLFAGVLWEHQNVMLEDLDRIEVISGPGGTLYGANAVNGIINVISRDSRETLGGLISGAVGNAETDLSARYGVRLGEHGALRVYVSGFDRGHTLLPSGADADDGWSGAQAGFRADWGGERNAFTLQGDLSSHDIDGAGSFSTADTSLRGGNLLGRWTHRLAGGDALEVQTYYDKAERIGSDLSDALQTWDVQAQYATTRGRHELVAGAGYRWTSDEFVSVSTPNILDPVSRDIGIGNVFIQDKIDLRENLALTLGLKIQNGGYTGVEYLPNLRIAWRPKESALLWAALSRAVRDPSRIERDFSIPGFIQSGTLEPEKLIALEAGYRGQPLPRTTLSVSLYANRYDDVRTNEINDQGLVFVGNGIGGETYGVEAWGSFDVTERWRLFAGLNLLRKDLQVEAGRTDLAAMLSAGSDPDYQLFLRSQVNLPYRLELDVRMRAVDERPVPKVSGYVEADARLGWRATDAVELYVAGFNLLDAAHPEDIDRSIQREIRRSVHAGARWRF